MAPSGEPESYYLSRVKNSRESDPFRGNVISRSYYLVFGTGAARNRPRVFLFYRVIRPYQGARPSPSLTAGKSFLINKKTMRQNERKRNNFYKALQRRHF